MRHGKPTVCVPDPLRHDCLRPYHDSHDVDYGGPHDAGRVHHRLRRRQDGRLHQGARELHEPARPDGLHRQPAARHDGLPRPARDPELLDLRQGLRAPGPHVRVQRVVEPAGPPVHGLGVVGALHRGRQSVQLHLQHRGTGAADRPRAAARQRAADYAWTDLTYLFHHHNVSWGYFIKKGPEPDCESAQMFCTYQAQSPRTPGIWNPLPSFDTSARITSSATSRTRARSITAVHKDRLPQVSWVIPSGIVSEHPTSVDHARDRPT